MATYAIGDIQGCYLSLQSLLKKISFSPNQDRLWLVGDLVNRGPRSLEVLRWAQSLGDRVVAVLGNHDLHLLARAAGVSSAKRSDTLEEVLQAKDRDSLLDWLRSRPLLHREGDRLLIHAGLLPQWTPTEAEALAAEIHAKLQGASSEKFLASLGEKNSAPWSPDLKGLERRRAAAMVLTRLRICDAKGHPAYPFTGVPEMIPPGYFPWFEVPERKSAGVTIFCGHWASLGLKVKKNLVALDSGCVWRRELSAYRLEDGGVFQVPYSD